MTNFKANKKKGDLKMRFIKGENGYVNIDKINAIYVYEMRTNDYVYNGKHEYKVIASLNNSVNYLATYSTKEIADKAMNMIIEMILTHREIISVDDIDDSLLKGN